MKVEPGYFRKMKISASADKVLNGFLARFPPLIIDRTLRGAKSELIRDLEAGCGNDRPIAAETITMPRRYGSGPRPATVATTGTRILYRGLVTEIEATLPEASRSEENTARWSEFGSKLETDYAVYLDIAACYEYIDHATLKDELLVRSMNLPACEGVSRLLGELMGRSRGLPQMHWASDRLADAYLDVMVRRLGQQGHAAIRYVDDIRVPAPNWLTALDIVESVADCAREMGLTLSAEKTKIYKRETLIQQVQSEATVLNRYFAIADELSSAASIFAIAGPYGPTDRYTDEQDSDEGSTMAPGRDESLLPAAMWELLKDWYALSQSKGASVSPPDSLGALQQFLPAAAASLIEHDVRIGDDMLKQWAFLDPSSIRSICEYIVRRAETLDAIFENHWGSIEAVISQSRRSPWSKIWILHAIGELVNHVGRFGADPVLPWVLAQLNDKHELVRAEAAWAAASLGALDGETLSEMYRAATPLSQHALAAAMELQDNIDRSIHKAISNDGPLNRKAVEWTQSRRNATSSPTPADKASGT